MKKEKTSSSQRVLDEQLLEACSKQDYQKIKESLDAGANPNAVIDGGENFLSPLCELISNCVQWDDEGEFRYIADEFWEALNLLIQKRADVNFIVRYSRIGNGITTALQESWETRPEVVKFLLDRGADPNVINENDRTVLDLVEYDQYFAYEGTWTEDLEYWTPQVEIRKLLLDYGAHRAETLACMKRSKWWKKNAPDALSVVLESGLRKTERFFPGEPCPAFR